MKVDELLSKAAKLVEEGKWYPGETPVYDGMDCYCVGIAIDVACVDESVFQRLEVYKSLLTHLKIPHGTDQTPKLSRDYVQLAINWNDVEGRTKQEVLEALRGAAKEVRDAEAVAA